MAAVAVITFWNIRQKIYRFLNFNMVFQLVLTIFFKSELFSCLPKFITWPTDAKDLLPLGKFWNGCFSFNIGPIKTKLKNVANLNVLFLTVFFYPIKKDSYPAPLGLKLGNARLLERGGIATTGRNSLCRCWSKLMSIVGHSRSSVCAKLAISCFLNELLQTCCMNITCVVRVPLDSLKRFWTHASLNTLPRQGVIFTLAFVALELIELKFNPK